MIIILSFALQGNRKISNSKKKPSDLTDGKEQCMTLNVTTILPPLILIGFGLFFFYMLFNAFLSREIKARGWGFSTRIYQRDGEPIMYWVNFIIYLTMAVCTTVIGFQLIIKSLL